MFKWTAFRHFLLSNPFFVHVESFSFLSPTGQISSLLFLLTFIFRLSPKVMYRQMDLFFFISDPHAQYTYFHSCTCASRVFGCYLKTWVSAVTPFPHCNWRLQIQQLSLLASDVGPAQRQDSRCADPSEEEIEEMFYFLHSLEKMWEPYFHINKRLVSPLC